MTLTAARFRRNWNPHYTPPKPPPFRLRPVSARQDGRWDRAAFSAWSTYCHVHGLDKNDAERMRRGVAKIIGREIASRRELTQREWKEVSKALARFTKQRDGGFHDVLYAHCPQFQADRRILPAVYAVLLGFAEPTNLAGAEAETWLCLWEPLRTHVNDCHSPECPLLLDAIAMLSGVESSAK